MSARSTINPTARVETIIERSRTYRQPINAPHNPYTKIEPAIRPLEKGVRGVPFELKVNWFRIKLPSIPIYIYEVAIERERRVKGRPSKELVTDPLTISTVFYNVIHSYPDVFPGNRPWRVFFDDFEFMFTPDELRFEKERILVTLIKNARNVDIRYRMRIRRHPNRSFLLGFPTRMQDADPRDAQWSAIFVKLMLSQNARFIPKEKRADHDTSIHARFAHFGGGMYFIPRAVGRNAAKRTVQPGVEAWMGFYIACRQMEDGDPVINFGMTNKFFMELKLSLLDFYLALINESITENRPKIVLNEDSVMSQQGIDDFSRRLSGLKLKCEWVPEKDRNGCIVGKVERHPRFVKAMNTTQCADNYYMNVFDPVQKRRRRVRMDIWYAEQEMPLKYPKLPLCEVGTKKDYVPMELLFTHDKPQKFTKLLDPYARMRIPQILSRTPAVHQKLTTEMVANKMEYQNDCFLDEMNVNIASTMVECTGRVLNKIGIKAHDHSGKLTSEQMNAETGEFPVRRAYETTEKETIFVVCKATNRTSQDNINSFYRGLAEKCKSRGMRVSQRELFRTVEPGAVAAVIEEVLEFVEQRKTKNETLVFLFFIGNTDEQLYGEIKLLSDLYHGVVTQVITESTVIKIRANTDTELADYKTVFHNIWLKLNVKLGGVNQIVDFSESSESQYGRLPSHERTMFIGIDVIHPSPNAPVRSFSIAAIVASTDKNATKYADRIMVNRNCNETVQHFEHHFSLLLQEYVAEQKKGARSDPKDLKDLLPERVVILRDGVSDSEMILAASRELQSIKEAWRRCADGSAPPPFTYIVVQKRHKTRFYRSDVAEKNANPFPGTVVTEGAVSPHKFDFYMISHHTPEGTSRPAHYTVVVDESAFSTDEITEMCFRLCCIYSRCSKPVSIPTPVYYAHLRCKRAAVQFLAAIRSEPPQLAEIEDMGPRESEQQYMARVDKEALEIEKLLNRDFNAPKKYPGMHFV